MNHIVAMAVKDIKLIFTSKATIFFTFIFPLLFVLLFGALMGGDKSDRKLTVALVLPPTLEQGALDFVTALRQADEITVVELPLEQAQNAVRKGQYSAFIALGDDFSRRWNKPFSATPPSIQIGADPSRGAETAMLEGLLMKYAATRFRQWFSPNAQSLEQWQHTIDDIEGNQNMDPRWKAVLGDYLPKMRDLMSEQVAAAKSQGAATATTQGPDMSPLAVERVSVVKTRNGPSNAYSVLIPQAVVWAMLGGMMGFGVSLAKERARGTLVRLQAAPMPAHHILLGKALACVVTLAIVTTGIMVLGAVIFGVPVQSPLLLVLGGLAVAFMFTGLMLALTVIAKTEEAIGGGGWGVFMVLSMIGGNMVPLFLMPAWMQTVALISPIRWAIVALEGAIWRQYSLLDMVLPVAVCLALAALGYGLAMRLFRRDWVNA